MSHFRHGFNVRLKHGFWLRLTDFHTVLNPVIEVSQTKCWLKE